jgi:hypothetical protein
MGGGAGTIGKTNPAVPRAVSSPDLCLDRKLAAAKPLCDPLSVGSGLDHASTRDMDTEPYQQLLGLEFVKVHARLA